MSQTTTYIAIEKSEFDELLSVIKEATEIIKSFKYPVRTYNLRSLANELAVPYITMRSWNSTIDRKENKPVIYKKIKALGYKIISREKNNKTWLIEVRKL
jgi:hypothetical protein